MTNLPILLVHGNMASSRWWSDIKKENTFAVDLPGFGLNYNLYKGGMDIQDWSGWTSLWLKDQGIDQCWLVGHSLGGAVVQRMATLEPERFPGMMLVSSCPPKGMPYADDMPWAFSFIDRNRPFITSSLSRMMPRRLPPYFLDLVDDAMLMPGEAYLGNARALANFRLSPSETEGYEGHVLVIQGERDPVISTYDARRTEAAYPNSELVTISGVGHSPQIEAPYLFNGLLNWFS